jgi:hypothetical protein
VLIAAANAACFLLPDVAAAVATVAPTQHGRIPADRSRAATTAFVRPPPAIPNRRRLHSRRGARGLKQRGCVRVRRVRRSRVHLSVAAARPALRRDQRLAAGRLQRGESQGRRGLRGEVRATVRAREARLVPGKSPEGGVDFGGFGRALGDQRGDDPGPGHDGPVGHPLLHLLQ